MSVLALAGLLIPVLSRVIPDIAGWLGGSDAESTAGRIVNVVESIAGSTDPVAVAAALQDPQKGGEIALALARIQAEREAKWDEQVTARIQATMADLAHARTTTVQLAQARSPIAWLAPTVCGVIFALFALVVIAETFGYAKDMNEATRRLLDYLAIAAASYSIGSSAGNAAKDARQVPAGLLPAVMSAVEPETPSAPSGAPARRSLFGGRD